MVDKKRSDAESREGRAGALPASGRLRRGVTTGTCAAAAAKAAAAALLSTRRRATTEITLPGGQKKRLTVQTLIRRDTGGASLRWAEATIIKDAGSDPDVTHGAHINASVALRPMGTRLLSLPRVHRLTSPAGIPGAERIEIFAGRGIGMVTRPGLPVPPGEPAINPVPARMITKALLEVIPDDVIATVVLSIPEGRKLARRTLNSRLGIIGGLSILGTTGIVEPMSAAAIEGTIESQISIAAAEGKKNMVLTPGRKGEKWAVDYLRMDEDLVIPVGNSWGYALGAAARHGMQELLLAAHPSKLAKLATGASTTHSYEVDVPFDLLASIAGQAGASQSLRRSIEKANTVEEFLPILSEDGPDVPIRFFELLAEAVISGAKGFTGGGVRIGVAFYDRAGEVLFVKAEEPS